MSSSAGRIYRRGNVWWIDYGHGGTRHRESSHSRKKGDARALLKRRIAEHQSGRFVGREAELLTFSDLAELIKSDYRVQGRRSLGRLQLSLRHLRGYLGRDRALDITTCRLRAYVVARRDEGAANSTIRTELAALKRAFNIALEDGRLPRRPSFPKIRVDNVRERCPTAAEVDAIVAELADDLRPVVRFAALTGCRKSEVLGLRWRDVDFASETIRIDGDRSKNAEARTFPFGTYPQLATLLRELRARTDRVEKRRDRIIPHVFHREGDQIRSMREAWKGATKRAGCTGLVFHDLRRHAVVNLERAGVPRSVAMQLTGHKTESVYRRYAIADQAALADGVAKLAELHATQPATPNVIPLGTGRGTVTAQSGRRSAAGRG